MIFSWKFFMHLVFPLNLNEWIPLIVFYITIQYLEKSSTLQLQICLNFQNANSRQFEIVLVFFELTNLYLSALYLGVAFSCQ